MPIWMLLAIMPLVIGGPEVAFCQLSLYWKSLYLPVFGKCFSSRPSSFRTTPPVTVLVVVFCVPIPISRVSALAVTGTNPMVAATSKGKKPESLDAGPTLIELILSNRTVLDVVRCPREVPRPQRKVAGLLDGEQADWLDEADGASDMPRDPRRRPAAGNVLRWPGSRTTRLIKG